MGFGDGPALLPHRKKSDRNIFFFSSRARKKGELPSTEKNYRTEKSFLAKLGEEKLAFQKAPGKLEPRAKHQAQAGPRSSCEREALHLGTPPWARIVKDLGPQRVLKLLLAKCAVERSKLKAAQRSKWENRENDIFGVKKMPFWGSPLEPFKWAFWGI